MKSSNEAARGPSGRKANDIAKRMRAPRGGKALSLAVAGGIAAVASVGCGELPEGGEAAGDTTSVETPIIGGSAPLSIGTQRSLGLVRFGGCSGALFTKDFVMTASHCVSWSNVPSMDFAIPRADGTLDHRPGVYAVRAGSSDISVIKLGPAQAGNTWPNVSHPITPSPASAFVGTDITCYGEGFSQYQADGSGVTNFGTYMSIVKRVLSLTADPLTGDFYTDTSADGQHVLSWGDSGSNCFTPAGEVVAVHSAGDCSNWVGTGTGVGCDQNNVIAQLNNYQRATAGWRSYLTSAVSRAGTTFEPLTLTNNWTPAAFGANSPGAAKVGGVVTLRGALSGGTTNSPFTLPPAYSPSARVYVPVSLVNSQIGRLVIEATGAVAVECEGGSFCSDASSFLSLDGVSFLQDVTGATVLTPIHGWATSNFGNRFPAVKNVNGQVHFMGAISTTGTDNFAFTLPAALRPSVTEWIPIGLCNAAKGRMRVLSTGDVTIEAESGFDKAGCFTSLEGASYALTAASGTAPTLAPGWTSGAFNSGPVRVRNDNGVVRFSGATSLGTGATVMTLPAQFRPATNVWLYVDFFGAGRGRVLVSPSGTVSIDPATTSALSGAESFLSFEGAEFGI